MEESFYPNFVSSIIEVIEYKLNSFEHKMLWRSEINQLFDIEIYK